MLALLSIRSIYPQDVDIVPYLKLIENGKEQEVNSKLPSLLQSNPKSSSVLFLKGILTKDGEQALKIYLDILNKYPNSKYADASVYRIYNYYYSTGSYKSSDMYLERLKKEYPGSPYIKIAERNIPAKDTPLVDDKIVPNEVPKIRKPAKSLDETDNYVYTIQAGAFSVEGNAESLKKKLEEAGYFSRIENKMVAGTIFHVVYTGKFQNEEDAKSYLQLINSKYSLDGRITKADQDAK